MNIFERYTVRKFERNQKRFAKSAQDMMKIKNISDSQKSYLKIATSASEKASHIDILDRQKRKSSMYFITTNAILVLSLLMILFVPFHSVSTSAYQNNYTAAGKYVKITASPTIVMNLETTSNYATTYQRDSIIVESNASNYDIYLSTNSNSNSLFIDGNAANDYLPATSIAGSNLIGMSTNSWGYGVSTLGSTTSEVATAVDPYDILYYPVPVKNSEAKIISYSGASAVTSNTYDVYFGVKANKDKPNGTYSNDVLYSAISNTSSTVGTATVSPTEALIGSTITITTDLTTNMDLGSINVTLLDYFTNTQVSCASISTSTIDNIVTISCQLPTNINKGMYKVSASIPRFGRNYSIDEPITVQSGYDFFGITTMQQMTTDICSAANTPSISARYADTTGEHASSADYVPETILLDARGDGNGNAQTYVVRKYADGNCWMAQNLDLKLTNGVALNNKTTDLNTKTSWSPKNTTQTTITNTWSADQDNSYYPGAYYCYGTTFGSGQTCSTTMTASQTERVGTYYQWSAATAGSGNASMRSSSATNTNIINDSICPKGWRLPSGAQSSSLNTNGKKYSIYNLLPIVYGFGNSDTARARDFPFNYVMGGMRVSDAGLSDRGVVGFYFTNSPYTTAGIANAFRFNVQDFQTQDTGGEQHARSLRCVAR